MVAGLPEPDARGGPAGSARRRRGGRSRRHPPHGLHRLQGLRTRCCPGRRRPTLLPAHPSTYGPAASGPAPRPRLAGRARRAECRRRARPRRRCAGRPTRRRDVRRHGDDAVPVLRTPRRAGVLRPPTRRRDGRAVAHRRRTRAGNACGGEQYLRGFAAAALLPTGTAPGPPTSANASPGGSPIPPTQRRAAPRRRWPSPRRDPCGSRGRTERSPAPSPRPPYVRRRAAGTVRDRRHRLRPRPRRSAAGPPCCWSRGLRGRADQPAAPDRATLDTVLAASGSARRDSSRVSACRSAPPAPHP